MATLPVFSANGLSVRYGVAFGLLVTPAHKSARWRQSTVLTTSGPAANSTSS